MAKSWYDYFNESSLSMGVPAPPGLFATFTSTATLLSTCCKVIEALSLSARAVTVAEVFGHIQLTAGVALGSGCTGLTAVAAGEVLAVVGACTASYVLGVWIGAAAFASGQVLGDVDIPGATGAMRTGWEWWYGVPQQRAQYAQMQARLAHMRRDKVCAELMDRALRLGIQIDRSTWPGTVLTSGGTVLTSGR